MSMGKEALLEKIEKERRKLNRILEQGDVQEAYFQSVLLDGLIEKYLAL